LNNESNKEGHKGFGVEQQRQLAQRERNKDDLELKKQNAQDLLSFPPNLLLCATFVIQL